MNLVHYKLPEWHYHSITAHIPCVTVPLSILAYGLLLATGRPVFGLAHAALAGVALFSAAPVAITGYLEREGRYVNWTPLFRAKMLFTGLLLAGLLFQTAQFCRHGIPATSLGALYAAVTFGLNLVSILLLCALGVITAQGVLFGLTSYRKDPECKTSYDIVQAIKSSQPDPAKEEPYDRL